MVVITTFPPPTEGIKHEQPETAVLMNEKELGKGTVYIAESCVSWVDSITGRGFSLEYPHICIHAISRDLQNYPKECLYLMLDTNIEPEERESGNTSGEDTPADEDQGMTEIRFVPDDASVLDAMFAAMRDCTLLHPGSQQSFSEEEPLDDDEEDEDDDEAFMDADEDFQNRSNGMQGIEIEGQFDDAEADAGFEEN